MRNLLNTELPNAGIAVVTGIAVSFGLFVLILTLSGKGETSQAEKPPVVINLLTWQPRPKTVKPVKTPTPTPQPVNPERKKAKKPPAKPRPEKISKPVETPPEQILEPVVKTIKPQQPKPVEQPPANSPPAPVPLFKLTRMPVLLHKELPVYPDSMRAIGKTATVLLELLIDGTGKVTNVAIIKSGGRAFDEAAKSAFERCSFTPAEVDGKSVTVLLRQPVTFQLN